MTLITRPRRFGKTLTMSMLEKFFSLDYAGRGGVRKTGTTLIRVSTVMGILYRIRISSADIVRKEKYSEEIC